MLDIGTIRRYRETRPHSSAWYYRVADAGQLCAFVCFMMTTVIFWADLWVRFEMDGGVNRLAPILPGGYMGHCYFRFVEHLADLRGDERVILLAYAGYVVLFSLHTICYSWLLERDRFFGFSCLMLTEGIASFAVLAARPELLMEAPPFWMLFGATLRVGMALFLAAAGTCDKHGKWMTIADILLWAAEKRGWSERFCVTSLSNKEYFELEEEYYEETGEKRRDSE